ncbi:mRNA capping enzyme, putative [Medicago truncatula]|uniref:mRNA capping enzyme, putative n=1 Tax=Medicago truncatula TaxID=3880 RepID=G7KS88_MEDTR|nr:mRNA capping enzyme, putative [Medicago truncatula]
METRFVVIRDHMNTHICTTFPISMMYGSQRPFCEQWKMLEKEVVTDNVYDRRWDDPYVRCTHEGLLKWKYATLNSVDFLFEIVDDRRLLFIYERGQKKPMEGFIVAFEGSDLVLYSRKIIECAWDGDRNKWIIK